MISVKEQYIIDNEGKTTNVVLTKKDYDRLMDYIDELEDVAAYDKVKEKNDTVYSWKKVKK